ncbi:hypothetical protein WG66_005559 [Moniliophthora roreri]|nr:hypothetical protein WG66_005559 [Moniliophthora roreri]
MNAQLAASCLGLSLSLCDIYLTRREEKALIWRPPFRITIVKTLYILSRYLGLTCHMYNVVRSAYWKYRYITIPQHSCANYLVFKTSGAQCLAGILHIILILRVYALYNKSLVITLSLILLFSLRFSATIWTVVWNWEAYTAYLKHLCFTTESVNPGPELTILIVAETLFQIIIHTLTMKKTWMLPGTWSKTPTLTSVLTRDSFYVFIAMFGVMTAVAVGSYGKGPAALFIHPLLVFVVSCAGTRVILRLQRFGNEESPANSQGQQDTFSTVAWDLRTFPRNDL